MDENTQNTQTASDQPAVEQQKHSHFGFFRDKLAVISAVVLIVIVAIIGGVFFFTRPDLNTDDAVEIDPSIVIATVGGEQVTMQDVYGLSDLSYARPDLTREVIEGYREQIVEKKILDQELAAMGIVLPQIDNQDTYYATARGLVTKAEIESYEYYVIGFWVPPFDSEYEQLTSYQAARDVAPAAFAEIESRLAAGEEPLVVARSVLEQYPQLENELAINGYIMDENFEDHLGMVPVLQDYDPERADEPFFVTIAQAETGDIYSEIYDDGSGADAVKVLSISRGEQISYEEWLAEKKEELVEYHDELFNTI